MKQRTEYLLVGLRETSLVAYAFFSVYLSYMLAECMVPIIRYFIKADLVLTESEFKYLYIIPSIVLCLFMYYFIRRNDKISFKFLVPIQILFFSLFHFVLLLITGNKVSFYWCPGPSEGADEYSKYHAGLRHSYTSIVRSSKEIYGSYEIWIKLGIVLLILISFAVIYRILHRYIKSKTQSSAFAQPMNQNDE